MPMCESVASVRSQIPRIGRPAVLWSFVTAANSAICYEKKLKATCQPRGAYMQKTKMFVLLALFATTAMAADRPNILWITSEDNGPHLGCYGDAYATTPNLDELGARSLIYKMAWSNAPVCAPARTTIISGVYPPATGAEHMRSMTRLPPSMKMYPQYLREAGYYCTNKSKEDYNLAKEGTVWDESSKNAHWRNRAPGQPFFAIFNFTVCHESQIRKRPHTPIHDPAKVRVPAYHPDTPEVRLDWAQYHDKLTEMDTMVGNVLAELAEDGLADDTIIFYYGDHGSGMPRSKRWPYNSGLQVPMIVHIPEKFAHLRSKDYAAGHMSDRLVGFIDLAPTVLSLVGQKPPKQMQGGAFHGEFQAEPSEFLYGFRGRMDERYDMVRSVTDGRYVYIRQYMPHRIYGQYLDYMFKTPTTRIWHAMYREGKLNAAQSHFWREKPTEELYDLQTDPDEVRNLTNSQEHAGVLKRLRQAHRDWVFRVRDVGFMPEAELHALGERTPYEFGHSADYDLDAAFEAAQVASRRDLADAEELVSRLASPNVAVRYWAAMGLLGRPNALAKESVLAAMRSAAHDARAERTAGDACVRSLLAEALGRYGAESDVEPAIATLVANANVEEHGLYVSMFALNSLDYLDEKARIAAEAIRAMPKSHREIPKRLGGYIPRLLDEVARGL